MRGGGGGGGGDGVNQRGGGTMQCVFFEAIIPMI